jgi:hypothetical protein
MRKMNRRHGMTPELYRQNMIELMVLQALQGALTSQVKALSLEFENEDVIAHFVLRGPSPADEEEIRESFPGEVSALTLGDEGPGDILVSPRILHADEVVSLTDLPGRVVFWFRD